MKKKFLAVALMATAALALSACAPAAKTATVADKEGTPKLLVWVDSVREPAAKAYKASIGAKADVTIEVYDTNELKTKIALFNSSKKGWPDVVFAGQPNDVAALAAPDNGYAAKVDGLIDQKALDDFGTQNNWCKIEGNFYCFKNDMAQTVLWYNTKIFKELGLTVPKTMKEWAETALKLKGTGYSAGAVGDQNFYASFLSASGCPMTDVVGVDKVRIDPTAKECTRVPELVQPLLDAGVLDKRSSFDAGFLKDVATQNKIAMTFGPSWFGDFVIRPESSFKAPAGEFAAALSPTWDGDDKGYSGEWGGGVWMVSSHSEYPKAATHAAWYMAADPTIAKDFVTFPASNPANVAWSSRIAQDKYYAEDITKVLTQAAAQVRGVEKPVRYDLGGIIGKTLQADLNAGKSAADAVKNFMDSLATAAKSVGYEVVSK